MMIFIAKKLLLDSEITSLDFYIFKDQSNTQECNEFQWAVPKFLGGVHEIIKENNLRENNTNNTTTSSHTGSYNITRSQQDDPLKQKPNLLKSESLALRLFREIIAVEQCIIQGREILLPGSFIESGLGGSTKPVPGRMSPLQTRITAYEVLKVI